MQVIKTPLDGLLEIIPTVYFDDRGWFFEFYKESEFLKHGITTKFVQENQSFTKKGIVRGLHYQSPPHAQAKLVSIGSGKVLDVVVDMRRDSKTFRQVYTCILDGSRHNMMLVPEGFAHGFAALEDSIFIYKCSDEYHPDLEKGIVWNDPSLAIDWQIKDPIVSAKDKVLPTMEEFLRKSVISPQ
ncbi:MAG TPA: dTDP-4-dehydrorhamnose 3,5-epimerase [Cyclobacteriaceae bacterium]|nr:dTDP-4-dehydrorhamnose 3,5-epimerase [Cyclobacteriaceae bacterium]